MVLEKITKVPETAYLLLYTLLGKLPINSVFIHHYGIGKSYPWGDFKHIVFSGTTKVIILSQDGF